MSSVALTAALRANLLSLQNTAAQQDSTQFRLATGRKVNSALDNPSSFFSAQNLTNRATDLSALLDGQGQSIQVLKAADQGITSLTSLVKQAQSIAQSAQNTVTNTAAFRSGDVSSALAANVGAIATTLNLTVNGVTSNVVVANQSLATIAASINAITNLSAQVVSGTGLGATGTGDRRLEIRATNGFTLTIANNAAGTFFNTNQNGAGGANGVIVSTGGAYTTGNAIAVAANTPDQISLENQFNTIRTQIDQLVSDTGYQGTNLLNGDTLRTVFNEKGTSTLSVTGVTFNTAGLGVAAANFATSTNITTGLNQAASALNSLRAQAQSFGNNLSTIQTRQDFTKNLINTLKAGADGLTLADKNEEGANLLALQTAQQLGIQALSLASQANQSVLRLFS